MKRLFSIIVACAVMVCVSAQTRMPKIGKDNSQKSYSEMNTGFWISADVEGGASLRISKKNSAIAGLNISGGYRFSEYLKVGVGFGGRYYFNNDALRYNSFEMSFPLYATVRGNFIPGEYRAVVPYYSFDMGGAIRDGFMIRPTIGIRVGEFTRNAFLIGLTYTGQEMRMCNKENKMISFLSLGLGYEF